MSSSRRSSMRIGPSSCRARSAWARRRSRSRRPMIRESSRASARTGGSSSISNPRRTPTALLRRLAPISASSAIGRGFRSGGEDRRRLRRRADAGDPRQSGDALAQGHGRDRGAARPARGDRRPPAHHHRSRRAAQTSRPRRADAARRRTARRRRRARSFLAPCRRSFRRRPRPARPPQLARRPSSVDRAACRQCAGQTRSAKA